MTKDPLVSSLISFFLSFHACLSDIFTLYQIIFSEKDFHILPKRCDILRLCTHNISYILTMIKQQATGTTTRATPTNNAQTLFLLYTMFYEDINIGKNQYSQPGSIPAKMKKQTNC